MRGKFIVGVVVCSIVACGGSKSQLDDVPSTGSNKGSGGITLVADPPIGLDLRLSNGKQAKPPVDHGKAVAGTKLADGDVTALLARAKPITLEATDQKTFALRPNSQPLPRTGKVITGAFPPDPSTLLPPKSGDADKKLTVLRYMPEGAVPLAPNLTVTFSQPMIAVTSQDDAAASTPVKLTPTPKGRWRWLGTRTVIFDPDVRFPQATTYQIEVPAGTKSATGGTLDAAVKFSFETPTPTLVSHYPSDSQNQRTDVPMFLLFDQKVDAAAIVQKLVVKVNDKVFGVKQLDATAIAAHEDLNYLTEAAHANEQDGRWVAVRAVDRFPTNSPVIVTLPIGTPSAEGPNTTKAESTFSFHTYPPMELTRSECGYRPDDCRPGTQFMFEFTNAIDLEKLETIKQSITLTPPVENIKINSYGQVMYLQGATLPRTSYTVNIPHSLVDDFGQNLVKDEVRTFATGDAYPTFYGPSGMVVLDPAAGKQTLDFFATNYTDLNVRLYKVTPADYPAYVEYERNRWDRDHPPKIPGVKVFDSKIKTAAPANKLSEVHVDLSPALTKGLGHVIAIVEPSPWTQPYGRAPELQAWVQSTKLAVDAHSDYEAVNALVTELGTGKPAAGVSLTLSGNLAGDVTGASDGSGLAKLTFGSLGGYDRLVARRGEDSTLLVNYNSSMWSTSVRQPDKYAWYVVDDRKLYRPGEEVSLKGWVRLVENGKGGDVAMGDKKQVTYVAWDSRRNKLTEGTVDLNAAGAFDMKFTLPKTPNLGMARIEFNVDGTGVYQNGYQHTFRVEEFRRPEFEVTAAASQGPFLVGQNGDVTVSAKYYAGGGLPGAPVAWVATTQSTSYTPPNRDEYSFGTWTPWWESYGGYEDNGYYDDEGGYNGRYYGRGNNGRMGGKGKEKRAKDYYDFAGTTDGGGEHVLHFDFLSVKPNKPMQVTATASVTDVNRQQWSASTTMIVHPAQYYVGLKSERPFVDVGTPFDLSVIGVDLDGKVATGAKIDVKAVRLEGNYEKGEWKTKEVDEQKCPVTMAKDAGACHFATKKGGNYKVVAVITDPEGRKNESTIDFWVTGGDRIPSREVSQEEIKLIPDKKEYTPGNTAELLVMVPFYPAEGVLTWRRNGIVKLERITLDGPTKVIKVAIEDAMTPNLVVQLDTVGTAPRLDDKGNVDAKLPRRPAFASGSIDLKIPPKQRTLAVTVEPAAKKVSPAEKTSMSIVVKDASGKPVADSEIAVIVVDESILSLAAYSHPNPIDSMYPHRNPSSHDRFTHSYVTLARPDTTVTSATTAPGGANGAPAPEPSAAPAEDESGGTGTAMALDEGKMGKKDSDRAEGQYKMQKNNADPKLARQQAIEQARNAGVLGAIADKPNQPVDPAAPIAVRSNFNPLAAFAPVAKTDANGKATVEVTMPDNLTRYRIIAIASSGTKQFGKGESAVTARLPLMVRPSAPRFLNFGDTFQFPVTVQNQTDSPMQVKLAIRATNAKLTGNAGVEVTVAANDRALVEFPAAAEMAGTARFQVVGTAGNASDAANVELPVWTPATTEAFATYGTIDTADAMSQPIALPGKVVTEFGGLEITTASTNLQALTDAFLYIVHYKFECAEQRSSRILSIVTLKDVLSAFQVADMPSPAALEVSMADDMRHLTQMQNPDGGFVYWERGWPSEPYLSVYASNAIQRAKDKGYEVPTNMLDRAKDFLRNIESHYPWFYSKEVRQAISAYALYTRKLMGDLDIAKGKQQYADAGGATKLGMETNGWLLATFAGNAGAAKERAEIVRHATNRVSETAGAANFTVGYDDGAYLLLSSDRRVDSVMLDALISEQPANDLIPKLVTGLLAHKKAGRWLNTQENTWALIALEHYFKVYEKVTPNFVARMWLGNDFAGDHPFKGRSTEYFQVDIPMKDVATHDKQNLTIQKDGAGRLYYRVGMKYAPASLKLDAADYGFVVTRTYEGVDDPKDVTKGADGVWHIKAGTRVRVKLAMVNENRRYHVALVDPLPAGLEAVNPTLGVSAPVPRTESDEKNTANRYSWWYRTWYDHQNMRDERVEAFTQLLWEGVHDYTYVARATTIGVFIVPPPKAEEMYMPETFGRGASDKVIVE